MNLDIKVSSSTSCNNNNNSNIIIKRLSFIKSLPYGEIYLGEQFKLIVAITDELGVSFYFGDFKEEISLIFELTELQQHSTKMEYKQNNIHMLPVEWKSSKQWTIIKDGDKNSKKEKPFIIPFTSKINAYGLGWCELESLRIIGKDIEKYSSHSSIWMQLKVSVVPIIPIISPFNSIHNIVTGKEEVEEEVEEEGEDQSISMKKQFLRVHSVYSKPFQLFINKKKEFKQGTTITTIKGRKGRNDYNQTKRKKKNPKKIIPRSRKTMRFCQRRVCIPLLFSSSPSFVDIVIQESQDGSILGSQLWNASLATVHHLLRIEKKKSCIRSSVVLELGSGCGFIGAALCLLRPKKIFLTDISSVLPYLQYNIKQNIFLQKSLFIKEEEREEKKEMEEKKKMNKSDESNSIITIHNDTIIESCCLLWEDTIVNELSLKENNIPKGLLSIMNGEGFDYIIASEVLYNSTCYKILAIALRKFCTKEKTKIIIGHSNRLDDEPHLFFEECNKNDLILIETHKYGGDSFTIFILGIDKEVIEKKYKYINL